MIFTVFFNIITEKTLKTSVVSGLNNYEGFALLKYKHYCKKSGVVFTDIKRMAEYHDVCENYVFLSDIFTKKSLSVKDHNISVRELKDTAEWKYIFTQSDADDFMKKFAGFHDSTFETIPIQKLMVLLLQVQFLITVDGSALLSYVLKAFKC